MFRSMYRNCRTYILIEQLFTVKRPHFILPQRRRSPQSVIQRLQGLRTEQTREEDKSEVRYRATNLWFPFDNEAPTQCDSKQIYPEIGRAEESVKQINRAYPAIKMFSSNAYI